MRSVIVLVSALATSGCATVSFAPPPVETNYDLSSVARDKCVPQRRIVSEREVLIEPDVEGAITLTDNFILAYRCALAELADGRQVFEVPSLLAAVTGLIGGQYGLTNRGVLAAGASSAFLGSAQSYYAPVQKRPIVDAALGALLCIKTEEVGINHFNTTKPQNRETASQLYDAQMDVEERIRSDEQALRTALAVAINDTGRASAAELDQMTRALNSLKAERLLLIERRAAISDDEGTISLSAQRQYFEMVASGLFSVERILAQRLATAGTTDSATLLAKIKETIEAAKKAEKDANDKKGFIDEYYRDSTKVGFVGFSLAEARKDLIELRNAELQKKIQVCIQQAHL